MSNELVMVVDDTLENLKLMLTLLTRKGYTVCTATNASLALAMLESVHPRLILMDIRLHGGMDGITLTRRIKANPAMRDIPIVAMSAYVDEWTAARAKEAGCETFIPMPMDNQVVISTVKQYVERMAENT